MSVLLSKIGVKMEKFQTMKKIHQYLKRIMYHDQREFIQERYVVLQFKNYLEIVITQNRGKTYNSLYTFRKDIW